MRESSPYRMGDDVRGERYVVEPGTLCACCGLDGSLCTCSWACALSDTCTATKRCPNACYLAGRCQCGKGSSSQGGAA